MRVFAFLLMVAANVGLPVPKAQAQGTSLPPLDPKIMEAVGWRKSGALCEHRVAGLTVMCEILSRAIHAARARM